MSWNSPFRTKLTWASVCTQTTTTTSFRPHTPWHLQVPLPLIAMWCMDDSHSMQLWHGWVHKDFQRVIWYLKMFRLVLPIQGTHCVFSSLLVPATNINLYFSWQGIPWISSRRTQWLWLLRNLLRHHRCLLRLYSTDFPRRVLRNPTPMWSSLSLVNLGPVLLRRARPWKILLFCKALSASMPRINESATYSISGNGRSPPCYCPPKRQPALCPRFQASIRFPLGTFSGRAWK